MSSGSSAQHQVRKADDAKLSANSEEFLNEVEEFLRSRRFIGPVHGFLADNCKAFSESTADGECTHEHEIIHQKYIKFVFGLIEAFLQAHGVSQEEFVEACRKGLENGGKGAIVFREIMKADDFLYFQSKMILMWGHMQAREKGTEPPTPRGVCPDANAAKNMKR